MTYPRAADRSSISGPRDARPAPGVGLPSHRPPAEPASRTVAGNPDDAGLFGWYLRYAATAVAHGHLPGLITTALNAPQGINVMWNTSVLLPGIALSPVTLLFGPQVSLTVLTTAG